MMKIIAKLHLSKPPLGFPNIIARLYSEMEVSFLASDPSDAPAGNAADAPQDYGWGQLQEDMANLKQVQMEFYESILAQNAEYGPKFQSIERRQSDLRAD
ncbi:hypothetical protein PIB30_102463 [Stylosanthes scabra]|uniref:Uncharacterized protein n=1 Tax=Stylosanthes scabra TaxID=79078 RepID=A0ABU6YWM0_9FABA|nr:hypothetical protein [Stylosanthes scabra]